MRTIQKLSLIYGFEMNTDDEIAELWIAAATAAGVDISRELLEKEVVNKFVPRVIQRIAARAGAEVVEKWAGRLIPVLSSAIGGGLNYYFVRAWGQRAQAHFRGKHIEARRRFAAEQAQLRAQGQRPCRHKGVYLSHSSNSLPRSVFASRHLTIRVCRARASSHRIDPGGCTLAFFRGARAHRTRRSRPLLRSVEDTSDVNYVAADP